MYSGTAKVRAPSLAEMYGLRPRRGLGDGVEWWAPEMSREDAARQSAAFDSWLLSNREQLDALIRVSAGRNPEAERTLQRALTSARLRDLVPTTLRTPSSTNPSTVTVAIEALMMQSGNAAARSSLIQQDPSGMEFFRGLNQNPGSSTGLRIQTFAMPGDPLKPLSPSEMIQAPGSGAQPTTSGIDPYTRGDAGGLGWRGLLPDLDLLEWLGLLVLILGAYVAVKVVDTALPR